VKNLLTVEEEPPSPALAGLQAFDSSQTPLPTTLPPPAASKPARARPTPARLPSTIARITISAATDAFRKKFFPGVKLAEWNDWRWQNRTRIRSLAEL